ncbi:MAG: LysM peptidoglycan-binding domain-containing protein [Chitinophagales bacterium]|nr:LysM peptidoglycan-binding domain-containing protein [Chitinophagales bacterium]
MKGFCTILLLLVVASASAQQKPEVVEYINRHKDIAIEEMVRTKIPASITLAQGVLESGSGKSVLAQKTNNHFGIKCKEEWAGGRYYYDDDAPGECFRVYANVRESYADHSDFLAGRSRYADLFKLSVLDYKGWATGLKAAGYATNPKYADILIRNIEEYELHAYDRVGYAILQNNEKNPLPVAKVPHEKPDAENQAKGNAITHREEFLVNGIRAVKARGNEEPFAIAFEYNIDYAHVLSFNDLSAGEKFKDGENIFLQPKKNRGAETAYTVKTGESMRDIAQQFGIKLKDLYYKNLMKPNEQVAGGEVVWLQTKRSSLPKVISYAEYLKTVSGTTSSAVPARGNQAIALNNESVYEVQQKDTLYSIARRFNTSVERIKELNQIEGDAIKPGQTLVVVE